MPRLSGEMVGNHIVTFKVDQAILLEDAKESMEDRAKDIKSGGDWGVMNTSHLI